MRGTWKLGLLQSLKGAFVIGWQAVQQLAVSSFCFLLLGCMNRSKDEKKRELLVCLWSLWGENSEFRSWLPYELISGWATGDIWEMRKCSVQHVWVCPWTDGSKHIFSVCLKCMFKMSHQVALEISHVCGKDVSADFVTEGNKHVWIHYVQCPKLTVRLASQVGIWGPFIQEYCGVY